MAIVLHRFPMSHFSEKARVTLDFKGLEYRVEDHKPGPDQIAIYRLSGQRRLPVIEHDGNVVADSTEIAFYLERTFPEGRRLLPEHPDERSEVLALEEQLDAVLGKLVPLVWLRYATRDPWYLDVIGAAEMPFGPRGLGVVAAVVPRVEQLGPVKRRLDEAEHAVRAMLSDLCSRLETSKYLVGDAPSLADVAAVGLTFPLRFPPSSHLKKAELEGALVRGIADDPAFARFFEFRDQFYRDYLQ